MKNIPSVTVDQMREVDRLMVEEVGVSIIMMMENASRNIAILCRKLLNGSVKNKEIVILCGKGNNGGDGLGAARHLINFGAEVICILAEPVGNLGENARIQYRVLKNTQAKVLEFNKQENQLIEKINNSDLIIDALLGYNLRGNPNPSYSNLIDIANNSAKSILAIDIPSGLNGNTGLPNTPVTKAKTTLTLALPKVGLLTEIAGSYVGELYIADLSVPKSVYDKLGIKVPMLFEHEEIAKVG